MSVHTQERGKENPSAHPRTNPLNPRYKSRAVEEDGTRMLFVAVRRNLGRIAVDARLRADVARRLQAEGSGRGGRGSRGGWGLLPGRSRRRRASSAEDRDHLISYLNSLLRSMFFRGSDRGGGLFGFLSVVGLVFTGGRRDPLYLLC